MQCLYFKPRVPRSKAKGSGDLAGTAVLCEALPYKINLFLYFVYVFLFLYYLCEK